MAGKSLNKVQLIGNLGADPELRYTSSGTAVATINLATNERYKPANSDEWQDRTEWHRVVLWGRLAEIAGEYLAKGRQAYIEGRLQTRSWEDRDGNKRYTTEIVAQDLILLSGRGDSAPSGYYPPHPAETYAAPPSPGSPQAAPATPTHTGPPTASSAPAAPPEDDIPF
ncbi:single-stranded DNA-binding protein [candidate division KSB3 bacterium]|uniref:Single-stranded DNA-binding protein n=1 Tax=candidate division KSB3 bacterium TaxID=2044937 RepID=A0A2G6KJY2_9BACT|nr:MAG: single-stranded DNA-binding protein [candidate division KSB3 bacterium]